MSINSALLAGVSGLVANSASMAAISDNIANTNTTAYKRSQINFANVVTAQVVKGRYSAGGVEAVTRKFVSNQGLIQAASSPTDLAIAGNAPRPSANTTPCDHIGRECRWTESQRRPASHHPANSSRVAASPSSARSSSSRLPEPLQSARSLPASEPGDGHRLPQRSTDHQPPPRALHLEQSGCSRCRWQTPCGEPSDAVPKPQFARTRILQRMRPAETPPDLEPEARPSHIVL